MSAVARRTDPITSWVAAASVSDHARSGERAALKALVEAGDQGLDDFELAYMTGWLQTSVGVRRCSLVRQGLVEATDWRGTSPSGRSTIVWRATAAGRKALRELERATQ